MWKIWDKESVRHDQDIKLCIPKTINNDYLKVSKFRKQIMVPKLLPKNKPSSLSWKITNSRLIQKESLSSFCKKPIQFI